MLTDKTHTLGDTMESANENTTCNNNRNQVYCKACGRFYQNQRSYRLHLKRHIGQRQIEIKDEKENSSNNNQVSDAPSGENVLKFESYKYPMIVKNNTYGEENHNLPAPPPPSPISIEEHPINEKNDISKLKTIRYQCHLCDKSFKQKVHLTRHVKEHSGAKPYGCTICSVSFKRLENYNQHIQSKRHQFVQSKLYEKHPNSSNST